MSPSMSIPTGPNGEFPEQIDDWPMTPVTVVCATEDCPQKGYRYNVPLYENQDGVPRVTCFGCGLAPTILNKKPVDPAPIIEARERARRPRIERIRERIGRFVRSGGVDGPGRAGN